ncbi:hypothetical protein L1887_23732 [Cichorium endivia]|nr:hypothetical protein L1887_23732 [Cichorium endivia]
MVAPCKMGRHGFVCFRVREPPIASISPVAEASGSVAALAAKSAFEDVNSMAIDVLPWEKGDLSIKPSEGIKPSEVEMKKALLPVKTISKEKKLSGKEALTKLLRWHFGHPEYRGKQLEAIEAVLSGRDCCCLMPTGGGKSIFYQILALAKQGIENQVMTLKEKGVAAEYLSSTQTSQVRNKGKI